MHRLCKLTMDQAREIRDSEKDMDELAMEYHVSKPAIWRILSGRTYQEDGMKLRRFKNPGRKAKVPKADYQKIRKRYFNEDVTQTAIAKEYDVCHQTINKIINGELT